MNDPAGRAKVAQRVSRETLHAFDAYLALLEKWQRKINLVATPTLSDAWTRHVQDSLQVFDNRPHHRGHWVDLGSGGGFPGLICAIAARDQAPDLRFSVMESDARKCAFLSEVARTTETPVTILNTRIETARPQNAQIISARALAPLTKLCDFAVRHLASGGRAVFLKGRTHTAEQIEADRIWRMDRSIVPSETDPEAAIYIIGDLARV